MIVGISVIALTTGKCGHQNNLGTVPQDQKKFNKVVMNYSSKYKNEANPVKRKQILDQRNAKLANIVGSAGTIERWVGTVQGISLMAGGASVNIDIGKAELISGHSSRDRFRPAISKDTDTYDVLSELSQHQKVYISGTFVTKGEEGLTNLNWYHEGEAAAPEFHFSFNRIRPAKND